MRTHWKKLTNPEYLGAYALDNGQDIILTIGHVREEKVTGTDGKKDDCVVCHFAERGVKPMILNTTNMKMITKILGTPYVEEWAGHRIQIGVKRVKAFGDVVDALRVRDTLPIDDTAELPKCENCGNPIKPVANMSGEQVAAYTKDKYGAALCSECATKRAQEVKASAADE